MNLLFSNQEHIDVLCREYMKLLSMLTDAPIISTATFINKVMEISNMGEIIVCYLIDVESNEMTIVGSGTLIIEPKLIHGGKYVGHIEDIVVHESYRKRGIAQEILSRLQSISEDRNCYKIILDCTDDIMSVYKKSGFTQHGVQMARYKGTVGSLMNPPFL